MKIMEIAVIAVLIIVASVIIIVNAVHTNKEKEEEIEALGHRQILEKLPHISNLVSWYDDNDAYSRSCFSMINGPQELSAYATKWLLQTLLSEGLATSSLVAVSSELGYRYETWCGLLNFLAKKGFITLKKYKFSAIYDEFDLLIKPSSECLVIDITDIGKAYAKDDRICKVRSNESIYNK